MFRVDERKSAMRLLIDALPSDAASVSQPAVKSLLHVLLSSTHAQDVRHSLTYLLLLLLSLAFVVA